VAKLHLADILDDWLKKHKSLKGHYQVYRRSQFALTEWPDILWECDHFVGMSCDGVAVALAIMNDHVYYKDDWRAPKVKFMAADKDFFKKVARDLTAFHKETHKNHDCNISV
jgi:hypothetical protein